MYDVYKVFVLYAMCASHALCTLDIFILCTRCVYILHIVCIANVHIVYNSVSLVHNIYFVKCVYIVYNVYRVHKVHIGYHV